MEDIIKLQINGIDWQGWLSFSVNRSIENISGGFSLGLTEVWQEKQQRMPLACGMSCKLFLNSDLIIDGYIDSVEHSFDANSHTVSISGRDKSCDVVDCSAVHNPGEFLNLNILEIANKLASQFAVKVSSDADLGAVFPIFKLETGEKALDALMRGLKQRKLLIIPDKNGNLKIAKIGSENMDEELVQGKNILAASLSLDMKQRYSDYICLGQQKGNDTNFGKACSTKAVVNDDEIERYRPLVIRSSQQGNNDFMKQRAEWQCKVDRAKGTNLSVLVQGYRTSSGQLWDINKKVTIKSDFLGIEKELLIVSVVYSRSLSSGSTTELSLKDIDAFSPEPIEAKTSSSSSLASSSSSNLSMYVQQAKDAKTENERIVGGVE